MNAIGELFHTFKPIPEAYIDVNITKSCSDIVRKIREVTSLQHWSFAKVMEELLPFAMVSISPKDAISKLNIPKVIAPSNKHINRESLSNGLDVWVYQAMIVGNVAYHVPAIRFSKHSIAVIEWTLKEVSSEEILKDYSRWRKLALESGRPFINLNDTIELTLLTFLKEGYKIHSATSYIMNGNYYYRVAFIREDMFVEMTLFMDEYSRMSDLSKSEKVNTVC